jgi:hypothetical protein
MSSCVERPDLDVRVIMIRLARLRKAGWLRFDELEKWEGTLVGSSPRWRL